MKLLMLATVWYVAVAVAGVATWGALRRLGIGAGASWAVARLAGLVGMGFVGWMAGVAGLTQWWWVALAVLPLLAGVGWRWWRGVAPATLVDVEVVGVAAFVLLAWLRVPVMAISGTEKPMDLAILATLMRPGGFPPADPWLAGEALPYYYWGFVPWVAPAKLLGLAPDQLYNLLVPTLAAVTAQISWALARSLGGSRRSAGLASFLVVFAGTPDGWRQLLAGVPLVDIDLWASSRQIPGTITEFPLFTFHLGDLHPHLLATPLVLLALFLARSWGCSGVRARVAVPLVAVTYGAAAAANPWCALPTGVAVLSLVVAREDGFSDPRRRDGWPVWLQVAAAGALGWLLFAPFWVHFSPPSMGFAWVPRGTRWDHMLLFLGGVLLPPLLVAWEVVRRWGSFAAARRQLAVTSWLAAMTVVASVTGKPLLALGLGIAVAFLATSVRGSRRRGRPVWALAAVAVLLLVAMEVVYVKDPYGPEYFRMNTVFKASHQAFTLLAVVAPVLLGWLRRRRPARAVVAAALVVLAGLPHLAVLAWRSGPALPAEWSGLTWMAPGEREAARWLHRQKGVEVSLVEAVGDAYSDAARLSSASGVPAVLGWENHQLVWRGDQVRPETERRKKLIEAVYTSGDEAAVRAALAELGARFVAVGGKERQIYGSEGLEVVRRTGRTAFAAGEIELIQVHD
jgi:YYY domain-containing protein